MWLVLEVMVFMIEPDSMMQKTDLGHRSLQLNAFQDVPKAIFRLSMKYFVDGVIKV